MFQIIELPEKKYQVIYADPPWQYDFSETKSREIENKYPTLTVADIKAIPVKEITDTDAILFLWGTAPKLREALDVIQSWGFEYKTHCIWDKKLIGMGYWFRGQHELLLLGTKGSPSIPEPKDRISSVYRESRTEHSAKPHAFYFFIEEMVGGKSKVELFARHKRQGWDTWGNEVPKETQMLLASDAESDAPRDESNKASEDDAKR